MNDSGSRVFCPTCFQSYPPGTTRCPKDGTELIGLPGEVSLVGSMLDGKYEVGELLGRGGMGTVYKAVQKMIDREVALKILRPAFTTDMNAVKRFFREAKAVARLRSPNAVLLYDFGLAREGHLYYTMELVRGCSLSQALQNNGAFPVPRAIRIILHVARALEEAHGLGIIHRDLKPSNIMLVGQGKDEVAKVLDFGIAKLVAAPEGSTLLTDSGIAIGTPKYMSPEQATGGQVDYRSDLYSLGVILYEMLAGLHPFHGGTPAALMHQHVHEAPVSVRIVAPEMEIPVPLERLLNRLLAKRPGDRPRRVTEVTPELSALLDGSYDPHTTRMPRMASSPLGLMEIVGKDDDGSRWAYSDTGGIQDPRSMDSSREEETGTGRGIPTAPEPLKHLEPSEPPENDDMDGQPSSLQEIPDGDGERHEGTNDYTEETNDYTEDGVGGGDETPIYQPKISSTGKEDWRYKEFIPMDDRDEWTTTSKHIPRLEHDDTEPPKVEWDAPAPDWESPPQLWAEDQEEEDAAPARRSHLLRYVLMGILTILIVLVALFHYQFLDGVVERFGIGREPVFEEKARAPDGPEAVRARTTTPEPPVEPPVEDSPAPVPEPEPEVVPVAPSPPAGDLAQAEVIRRNGIRAAAVENYEAAIELFKRSRELGGEPEDLERLINECRRKMAEKKE